MINCTISGITFDSIVGSGYYANVWKGTYNNDTVAVKVYKTQSTHEYYTNELNMLDALSCTSALYCITAYIDAFGININNVIHNVIIYEFYPQNLTDLLYHYKHDDQHGIPLPLVKTIMKQLFVGLSLIHAQDIIHTDIKPCNILLTNKDISSSDDIHIKIGDFGTTTPKCELFKMRVSTKTYQAPELFIESVYDHTIDIWAACCTCYELITGNSLFEDEYYNETEYSASLTESTPETSSDNDDDEYIYPYMLYRILGAPPKHYIMTHLSTLFNHRGELLSGAVVEQKLISQYLAQYEISCDDAADIEDLLLCGLKYVPDDRSQASAFRYARWLN